VTGGAKGIGAAIVQSAAAEGAIPVIVDRDVEVAHGANFQAGDLNVARSACDLAGTFPEHIIPASWQSWRS
jgi:NAD(P)-dependent dehydrogenase (short-subunit alcohol dehydrogenase family)